MNPHSTDSDSLDIVEALKRLDIECDLPPVSEDDTQKNPPKEPIKKENCDKKSIAIGTKLSKIATLLPKGGTIKGTMKRKKLFKKFDSHTISRCALPK